MSFGAPFTFIMNTLVHLVDRGSDIMNTLNTESQHLENFIEAVSTYDVDKPTKKSSLIAPWLGIDRTPPGLSQRIGNYVKISLLWIWQLKISYH